MAFIVMLGLLIFLGSIVWFLIALIKKKEKKKILITMVVSFVVAIIAALNMPTTETDSKATNSTTTESSKVVAKKEDKKAEKETIESTSQQSKEEPKEVENKSDEFLEENKLIADDLQMSLGWALGELDSDGNPTENGTPNEGFSWAVFVTKIEIAEEGSQLNVYVTPEFLALDDSSKQEIIGYAQNSAMQYTENFEKLFTAIYDGNNQIGRSTVLDVSDFKFDK